MTQSKLQTKRKVSANVSKNSFLVTIAMGIGAVLELGRDIYVARIFGISAVTDAFFLATAVPFLFAGAMQDLSQQLLMPWFGQAYVTDNGEVEERLLLVFLLTLMPAILFVGLGFLLVPAIIKVVTGPSIDKQLLTTILQITLPTVGIGLIVAVLSAYLNAVGNYTSVATRRAINSVAFILFIAAFAFTERNISGVQLGWAFLVGYIAELLSLLLLVHSSIHFSKFRKAVTHWDSFSLILKASYFPIFVLLSARLHLVVERVLAGFLGVGSVSALSYARRTTLAIGTIAAYGINTVSLSEMSRLQDIGDNKKRGTLLFSSIRLILLTLVPITALVVIFRIPLTQVIFGSRQIDSEALLTTASLIAFFAFAIPLYVLSPLILSPFYAKGDVKTASIHRLLTLGVNLFFNIILIWIFGVVGIALAFLIAMLFSVIRSWLLLESHEGKLNFSEMRVFSQKLLVATGSLSVFAIISSTALSLGRQTSNLILIGSITTLSGISLLIFFVIMHLLNVEETQWIYSIIKKRLT